MDRQLPSPFIDTRAVELWDTCLRWRANGQLRDVSIESTWDRVARALAAADPATAKCWSARFFQAQATWEVVLDERIVAGAGTSEFMWPRDPVAVLNAAPFVRAGFTNSAAFDFERWREAAGLAVVCLDAALLAGGGLARPARVRVGMIGFADALALLGLRYDSAAGRVFAGKLAHTLAQGSFDMNVRLAAERGALLEASVYIAAARRRNLSTDSIDAAHRGGLRHPTLTEISSNRLLAQFANNVADALEPIGELRSQEATVMRAGTASGYASSLARKAGMTADAIAAMVAAQQQAAIPARIALRGAMQPFIDAPIDYPLRTGAIDTRYEQYLAQLARAHRLGTVTVASQVETHVLT